MGVQELLPPIDRRDHDHGRGPHEEHGRMEVRDQRILGSTAPGVRREVGGRHSDTSGVDPVNEHLGFAIYAKVVDPDNDLNSNSVYANLSIWFGTGNACEQAQKMHDDGIAPDRVAGDGIFSFGNSVCVNAPFPNLNWDGSIILLNATDLKGNQATSRLVLTVQQSSTGAGSGSTNPALWQYLGFGQVIPNGFWRSEDRRVGTECRSWWWPCQ